MKKLKNQQKIVEKPLRFTVLDMGVYPFDVLFTIGTTEEEVIEHMKTECSYELDEEERAAVNLKNKGGRTVVFKNGALLLWVKKGFVPVIAHEVYHVVELMMETIKTPQNEHTSEPCAYLTEYLWRQIAKFLNI